MARNYASLVPEFRMGHGNRRSDEFYIGQLASKTAHRLPVDNNYFEASRGRCRRMLSAAILAIGSVLLFEHQIAMIGIRRRGEFCGSISLFRVTKF